MRHWTQKFASGFAIALTAVIGLLIGTAQSADADEWFVKFEGIDGSAKDDRHMGWIDIMSISLPVNRPGTGGANVGAMELVLAADASSPKILESICDGTIIPKVVVEGCE